MKGYVIIFSSLHNDQRYCAPKFSFHQTYIIDSPKLMFAVCKVTSLSELAVPGRVEVPTPRCLIFKVYITTVS
jgi:hypothetical protein